ncbi:MAG: hypothetical protein LW698_04365 [Planctomycetaceae bacterium]|jgi:hypothetical protein|nr:hypothetical protein [Planctomycetaceae bacterium]
MTGPLLNAWNLDLGSAKPLVADNPDDTLALQPVPGTSPATWGLGRG